MNLLGVIVPLLYVLFITGAYAITFEKRYSESMAPAFFIQILLMLFSGMAFGSITAGIIIGVALAIGSALYSCRKNSGRVIFESMIKEQRTDIVLVVVLYLLVYVCNYGKYYHSSDEFMHWGNFLRETYNLDALYVTSPAGFYHRDYVPAITLFEALWCKLSFRLTEANAYRGIQMLQVSMLVPIITRTFYSSLLKKMNIVIKAFITFSLPLFFSGLLFYHTIYQDYIYGVLVFFCMWIIITGTRDCYTLFELTMAITVLILSKMTALAFLPMIVVFYVVYILFYQEGKVDKKAIGRALLFGVVEVAVPLLFWKIYYIFATPYLSEYVVGEGTGGQSYGGHGIRSLVKVLSHDGSISFQHDVEKSYLEAIITRGLFSRIPYVQLVVILFLLLLIYSFKYSDKVIGGKIRITALWILLAGIAYGFLMYYLYMCGFSEYEARTLASFERYMGTYAITAAFLTLGVVLYFSRPEEILIPVIGVVAMQNMIMFLDCDQILPGKLTGCVALYKNEADHICNVVPEYASVGVIIRNEMAIAEDAVSFYSYPRLIRVVYPGEANDNNVFGHEYTTEELTQWISQYDYVYFMNIDDDFIEKYSDIFENPEDVVRGEIYKVSMNGNKIVTRE